MRNRALLYHRKPTPATANRFANSVLSYPDWTEVVVRQAPLWRQRAAPLGQPDPSRFPRGHPPGWRM